MEYQTQIPIESTWSYNFSLYVQSEPERSSTEHLMPLFLPWTGCNAELDEQEMSYLSENYFYD